jgi:hypothetical protein
VVLHVNRDKTTKTGLTLELQKGTLHTCRKSNLQRNQTDGVETMAIGAMCFMNIYLLIRM